MSETPIETTPQATHAGLEAGGVFLLDCREADELATASIAGAAHIPMGEVPSRLGELPNDRPVVVTCHHGMRSLRLTHFLRANGFPNAQSMAGGIDAWSTEVDGSVPRY